MPGHGEQDQHGRGDAAGRSAVTGNVAGHSLRDEHTSTTWVPIRRQGSAADEQVSLVRATDILDGRPPGSGERTGN